MSFFRFFWHPPRAKMACSPELPAYKDGDGDDVFQHPALRRAGMSHSEFNISLPASDADRAAPNL